MESNSRDIIRELTMLIVLVIVGGAIGGLLAEGLLQLHDMSTLSMMERGERSYTLSQRIWVRTGLLLSHGFMFLAAGLMFGYIYHRGVYSRYLRALTHPQVQSIIIWTVIILVAYPAVGYLTALNESIDLPSWARAGQDANLNLMKSILKMESMGELLITLLLVGLMPALGEEIIFRGIIQNKLISLLSSPHLAIIISSVIFGLIHGQLGRVLPLSFLGLLLGYSYYYTRSFWVPVILHFLNNSLQVIMLYSLGSESLDIVTDVPDTPLWAGLISILITLALVYRQSFTPHIDESRPQV